jgi:amphi-Trp domain-containing protein
MARRPSNRKTSPRSSRAARPRTKSRSRKPRRARDLERTYTRAQFIAKLRRLAAALRTKRPFTIQVAGERLHVPARAEFNIEHERAGGVDEIEFQLRWRAD